MRISDWSSDVCSSDLAALAARPLSRAASLPWRLLVGNGLSDDVLTELRSAAPPGVIVERSRPDFTRLLRRARLSVSQGGYRSEEHTSELQSLMRISDAVFCLKKKKNKKKQKKV